jgi:hypothetical protein
MQTLMVIARHRPAQSASSKGTSVVLLAIAARKSREQFNDPYLSSSALERDETESSISFASVEGSDPLSNAPAPAYNLRRGLERALSAPND